MEGGCTLESSTSRVPGERVEWTGVCQVGEQFEQMKSVSVFRSIPRHKAWAKWLHMLQLICSVPLSPPLQQKVDVEVDSPMVGRVGAWEAVVWRGADFLVEALAIVLPALRLAGGEVTDCSTGSFSAARRAGSLLPAPVHFGRLEPDMVMSEKAVITWRRYLKYSAVKYLAAREVLEGAATHAQHTQRPPV